MLRVNQVRLRPEQSPEELEKKIRKLLHLRKGESFRYEIVRKAIDARKKPDIFYSYTVDVMIEKEDAVWKRISGSQVTRTEPACYVFPAAGERELEYRPVIIGTGPAGLFCGYMLALHGYRPILLERGMDVERRQKEVEHFWETGVLNPESNVQFGEGGAGTFSDGKLNTLVKDKDGRNKQVLSIFTKAGAPEHILYDSKPHIGTDVLCQVVQNMRQTILAHGGEVHFDTRVQDLKIRDGKICGVVTDREEIPACVVVLAIGHSARDTFRMLYERQIPMECKAFAVGLRAEHPQELIDRNQYGRMERGCLPAADYKLTAKTSSGRGVYSFCMCPGGYVVNASSEPGRLAVNGMSYSSRAGKNANSAIIVSVTPEDFPEQHPLAGITFQEQLEKKAYELADGKIPVERYGDFYAHVRKQEQCVKEVSEEENYLPEQKGSWELAEVHRILPEAVNEALIEGMESFGRIIPGFDDPAVLLSGVESRTSSPVRIPRDETGQSAVGGLYPCGEGAGYAGGIMSAAMDGIRTAEKIASLFCPSKVSPV